MYTRTPCKRHSQKFFESGRLSNRRTWGPATSYSLASRSGSSSWWVPRCVCPSQAPPWPRGQEVGCLGTTPGCLADLQGSLPCQRPFYISFNVVAHSEHASWSSKYSHPRIPAIPSFMYVCVYTHVVTQETYPPAQD